MCWNCPKTKAKVTGTVPTGQVMVDGLGVSDVRTLYSYDRKHPSGRRLDGGCGFMEEETGQIWVVPILWFCFMFVNPKVLWTAQEKLSWKPCRNAKKRTSPAGTIKNLIKILWKLYLAENKEKPYDSAYHHGSIKWKYKKSEILKSSSL